MSAIWHQTPTVEMLNAIMQRGTIMQQIGIEVTEVGEDFLRGTMPADHRTHQPYGVIHGGANVVLAETLGSSAGYCCVDPERFQVFGQEVSATHIRSVSTGIVTGTSRPIHLGRTSQIWETRIEDERGKLTCISKLILAVVEKRA